MARKMKIIALLSTVSAVICAIFYMETENAVLFSSMIAFATTAYHLVMRLFIGFSIDLLLDNHVDYRAGWFRVSAFERKLYEKMKVKKWKGKMGSYDPSCFDSRIHSWDEIAQATCQAELVHELIIPLSFIPVLASIPFGALPVFVATSVLAACFDAMFVIIQRYNRPRIMKLIKGSSEKHCNT